MEVTEDGNFRLFAADVKRKRQTSVCLLPTETENDCCFSKRAHLRISIREFTFS